MVDCIEVATVLARDLEIRLDRVYTDMWVCSSFNAGRPLQGGLCVSQSKPPTCSKPSAFLSLLLQFTILGPTAPYSCEFSRALLATVTEVLLCVKWKAKAAAPRPLGQQ